MIFFSYLCSPKIEKRIIIMNVKKLISMKKLSLLLMKSLLAFFAGVALNSCDDSTPEAPYFPFSKVTKLEREDIKMYMSYDNTRLTAYKLFVNDNQVSSSSVTYKPDKIHCVINGIRYDIELDNVKGTNRAKSVEASKNGVPVHYVYFNKYDELGRVSLVRVDGIPGSPIYISYKYEGNKITVFDGGVYYTLELSSEDNKGYVCNVLDFAGSPITSSYVINPDLYFLNIYGTPVGKLPKLPEDEIEYSEDNQRLLRVGKYSYEY